MMETTYGHRVHDLDDEFVNFAQNAINATVEGGSPGSMLVDYFPVCEYLINCRQVSYLVTHRSEASPHVVSRRRV